MLSLEYHPVYQKNMFVNRRDSERIKKIVYKKGRPKITDHFLTVFVGHSPEDPGNGF